MYSLIIDIRKGTQVINMADKKAPQLRLLKVIVQPVIVVDDGVNLMEITVDPITVPANEWQNYPTTRWQEQLKTLQSQLNKEASAVQPKKAI